MTLINLPKEISSSTKLPTHNFGCLISMTLKLLEKNSTPSTDPLWLTLEPPSIWSQMMTSMPFSTNSLRIRTAMFTQAHLPSVNAPRRSMKKFQTFISKSLEMISSSQEIPGMKDKRPKECATSSSCMDQVTIPGSSASTSSTATTPCSIMRISNLDLPSQPCMDTQSQWVSFKPH